MKHVAIILLTAGTLSVPAIGQTAARPAAPVWPREVQQVYDELKADCRAVAGKFIPDRARFASRIEVTNDGKPDWVVEYDAARCSTSGASAYCGTAGCSIAILASARGGLTRIFNDNVRGWQVVDLGKQRKGLEVSVHGTACGSSGAEMCRQTLDWNGRKWNLVASKRGMDAAEIRAQQAEAADYVPPPQHEGKWISAGKGANALAAVSGHPSFAALGLRCQPGGGLFMSVVPTPDFALPPAGRDLMLSFSGYVVELEWTQAFQPEPGKRDFSTSLPDPLRGMLAGRDESLGLLASIDGGDEWQELDYLSLAGSSGAIRALEAQCAGLPGSSAAGQPAGGKLGFPPIPQGYYAYAGSCAEAIASGDANQPPTGLLYFDQNGIGEWDGAIEIRGFETLGNGRYRVRAWGYGNGDDSVGAKADFTIRVTGPASFVHEGTGQTNRHCPTNTVPAAIRGHYFVEGN